MNISHTAFTRDKTKNFLKFYLKYPAVSFLNIQIETVNFLHLKIQGTLVDRLTCNYLAQFMILLTLFT